MAAAALVTRLTATTAAALDAILVSSTQRPIFVLFTGEGSPSWCSDCNDAHPAIEAAFAARKSPCTLVEVPVVRDEYKGKPDYWARTHAARLQRVPSLVKWGAKRPVATLVETQCGDKELLEELVGGDDDE